MSVNYEINVVSIDEYLKIMVVEYSAVGRTTSTISIPTKPVGESMDDYLQRNSPPISYDDVEVIL